MSKSTKRTIGLFWALAFFVATLPGASCQPTPPQPPGPTGGSAPIPAPDGGTGGVSPQPADDCERAERRLTELSCPERVTPRGTPFAQTCRDSAADGRPYPTACIAKAATCEGARQCH